MSQSGDDLELRQGTGGGDGGATQAREVIAVGARDAFDQAEGTQAMKLTRQARGAQLGHEARQVGATHAVDIELGALQCPQKLLLGAFEEVQTFDGSITLALGFAEPCQIALAAGGRIPAVNLNSAMSGLPHGPYTVKKRNPVHGSP